MVRGISGGEKRRTMIAMELIISPHVLFLDEPTTGLDASTASSVMQLLHEYVVLILLLLGLFKLYIRWNCVWGTLSAL